MMSESQKAEGSVVPWEWRGPGGLVLRGGRTPATGKPLMLFLHGNGFCGAMYWPLLRRCLRQVDWAWLDMPGHGDSDAGGRFLGWNENAELAWQGLQSVRQQYRDQPVFLCGHSFGGVLSVLLLARHPDAAEAALVLDPVLFSPAMLGMMMTLAPLGLLRRSAMSSRARRRRAHWPDRRAAWSYLHGRGMFGSWSDEALGAYIDAGLKPDERGGLALKCSPQREAEIFAS